MILHTIHSLIEDVESFDVAVINIKLICLHQSIRKKLNLFFFFRDHKSSCHNVPIVIIHPLLQALINCLVALV